MGKYRLKDQELQKRLNELTNGDFTRQLEQNSQSCLIFGEEPGIEVSFGDLEGGYRYRAAFLKSEVVGFGVTPYNPNRWNSFPETTPPENVLMRVERTEFGSDRNGKGITQRDCSIFRKGEWVDPVVGYPMSMKIGRFRPWDEDQEAEE